MSDSPSENDDVRDQVTTDANAGNTDETASHGSSEANQDGHSESSPETPAAPKSMLEAVKAAAAKTKEASPPSEQDRAEPDKAPADKAQTEESKDELSDEELKKLNPKTQKRIKDLTRALAGKDREASGLKTKADEYDKIESFVRNSGLTNEVVGATLQIAALMRSNPREALSRMIPIVQQLQNVVGETLPPELAKRVQDGFLTEQDARALARSSADAALARRQSAEQVERTQAEQQRRDTQSAVDTTVSSVGTWEAKQAESDPDWNLKRDEIAEQVELAVERENRRRVGENPNAAPWFPSPEEAIKLSQDALKRVNDRFKRFTPKPRAIDPQLPGAASNRNAAKPKSMLDVVRQTVGAA